MPVYGLKVQLYSNHPETVIKYFVTNLYKHKHSIRVSVGTRKSSSVLYCKRLRWHRRRVLVLGKAFWTSSNPLDPLNAARTWDLNLLLKKFDKGGDSEINLRENTKTRGSSDWEKYRVMRNKVVTMRETPRKLTSNTSAKKKRGDQKKFLSTIKPRVNSRKNFYSGHTIVLKEKEQIIRD